MTTPVNARKHCKVSSRDKDIEKAFAENLDAFEVEEAEEVPVEYSEDGYSPEDVDDEPPQVVEKDRTTTGRGR